MKVQHELVVINIIITSAYIYVYVSRKTYIIINCDIVREYMDESQVMQHQKFVLQEDF